MTPTTRILFRLVRTIVTLTYGDGIQIKVSVPTGALQAYVDSLSGRNLAVAVRARVNRHVDESEPIPGAILLYRRKLCRICLGKGKQDVGMPCTWCEGKGYLI